MESRPFEIEAALMICSDNARAVAQAVSALAEIAGYSLLTQGTDQLHVTHLDTPARTLNRKGFALRVRRLGAQNLLALKGESQMTDWGGTKRLEVEGAWSPEIFDAIGRTLGEQGIRLGGWSPAFANTEPVSTLRSLGLEVIQDREMSRETKHVAATDGKAFAELAIDRVTLHLRETDVIFYQVEIEVKGEAQSVALRAIVEALQAMHPSELRAWRYGKLATGLALERMAHDGELAVWLDVERQITAALCDRLEAALQ